MYLNIGQLNKAAQDGDILKLKRENSKKFLVKIFNYKTVYVLKKKANQADLQAEKISWFRWKFFKRETIRDPDKLLNCISLNRVEEFFTPKGLELFKKLYPNNISFLYPGEEAAIRLIEKLKNHSEEEAVKWEIRAIKTLTRSANPPLDKRIVTEEGIVSWREELVRKLYEGVKSQCPQGEKKLLKKAWKEVFPKGPQ